MEFVKYFLKWEKMEELKNFIKTLDVLYVEDEESAREISTKIFKRFFNSVDSCENGLEGYLAYQQKYLKNEKYDLIISDINMPKLDGLDMTEKIREINKDVPIIFITARNESNVLLKAIELQVVNYIIKPLDIESISQVIYKSCEKLFLKSLFLKEQRELQIYLKTIEQIAFIFRMDINQNISYVNDIFCNTLFYEASEIIGKKLDFFQFSTTNKLIYEQINEVILNGKIWEGSVKTKTKNEETIHLKLIVMPIFDEANKNIKEFICISYLTTDYENEKKELVKKMFQNIATLKKESHTNLIEKDKQSEEIEILRKYILNQKQEIKTLNEAKSSLLIQLGAYEISSLNKSNGKLDLLRKKNEEAELLRKATTKLRSEKIQLDEKITDLETTQKHNLNLIEIYKNNEVKLKSRIRGLEDIVKNLEKQRDELLEEKKGLFK